jgi:hypothetical protein
MVWSGPPEFPSPVGFFFLTSKVKHQEYQLMSNRADRRAAERAILEAARCAAYANPPSFAQRMDPNGVMPGPDSILQFAGIRPQPAPQPQPAPESATVSAAQLAANRENAQKSTGPRTEAGRAAVRMNALKTGLTGRTVLIEEEDAPLYRKLAADFNQDLQPVGPQETALVQSVIDLHWRLEQIPGLLMALKTKGRQELLAKPEFHKYSTANANMLDIEVTLHYEKQFRNLNLQESRLSRRREKEMAELHKLQKERKANEAAALERAATAHVVAEQTGQPFSYPGIGFEFSKAVFEAHLASLTPAQKENLRQKAFGKAASAAA